MRIGSEKIIRKNPQETIAKKPSGRLTTTSSYPKTPYTPSHAMRNLEDTCLIFLVYTNANANDFKGSHTQGPEIVIVPRSCFQECSDGENRQTCPASDPSAVHPPNPKYHNQNHDFETALLDRRYIDSSKQTSDTWVKHVPWNCTRTFAIDIAEAEWPPSTIGNNGLTSKKNFCKTNLVFLQPIKTTCTLILILGTQKPTVIDLWKNLFQPR